MKSPPSLMSEMSESAGSSLYARPVYGFTWLRKFREYAHQFSNAGS